MPRPPGRCAPGASTAPRAGGRGGRSTPPAPAAVQGGTLRGEAEPRHRVRARVVFLRRARRRAAARHARRRASAPARAPVSLEGGRASFESDGQLLTSAPGPCATGDPGAATWSGLPLPAQHPPTSTALPAHFDRGSWGDRRYRVRIGAEVATHPRAGAAWTPRLRCRPARRPARTTCSAEGRHDLHARPRRPRRAARPGHQRRAASSSGAVERVRTYRQHRPSTWLDRRRHRRPARGAKLDRAGRARRGLRHPSSMPAAGSQFGAGECIASDTASALHPLTVRLRVRIKHWAGAAGPGSRRRALDARPGHLPYDPSHPSSPTSTTSGWSTPGSARQRARRVLQRLRRPPVHRVPGSAAFHVDHQDEHEHVGRHGRHPSPRPRHVPPPSTTHRLADPDVLPWIRLGAEGGSS